MDYCSTERQKEVLKVLVANNGHITKTAKILKVNQSTVSRMFKALKLRAAKYGFAPDYSMTHEAAPGFLVKGTSTLYGADGTLKTQWVKTDIDKARHDEMLKAAMDAFTSELPRATPVKHGGGNNSDLLSLYTITDYHIGMYAWKEESGDNWDTDIAEKLLLDWFATAVELSPNSETAILGQLGDFLHWDGMDAVTPASGHLLDADTRFQHLVRVTISVLRKVIDMLLSKHKFVHVKMCEGNHDIASSAWLREMFCAFYENEPRLTIDTSPRPYYAYEHGNSLLLFHHGHKKRMQGIEATFVSLFREEFGRTKHAFAHMGHMHHNKVNESSLMIVEQHRTLAAADAYAARGGWFSGRDAKVITYSKEFGEVSRLTVNPDLVKKMSNG